LPGDDAGGQAAGIFRVMKQLHFSMGCLAVVALVGCGGDTPPVINIWKASGEGNVAAVKQHIAAGTDINQALVAPGVPGHGGTPLHLAAVGGHREIAALLIDKGASLEEQAQDENGGTALSWAAFAGKLETVQLLLDEGMKVNSANNDGATALDIALVFQKPAVADLLKKNGGKQKLGQGAGVPNIDIWKASAEGHLDVVKHHLAAGADIDTPFVVSGIPGSGGSPLHLAAIFNQPEVAAYLIKEGANLENAAKDEYGGTPLHWAAFAGNVAVIKMLLEAGAKINATDKSGATAIDAAVVGQKIEAGGLLKQHDGKSGSEL